MLRGNEMGTRAMAPVPGIVARQAERLRLDGDDYCNRGRFGAAIEAYTEAIVLNPGVASCYVNRAECFWKRKQWGRVEEDCQKAINLNPNSFKGHYLLGLALIEREEHAEGIKELERAFALGRVRNTEDSIMKELWQNLAKAKFKTWELESSKRSRNLQKLKDECEKVLKMCYKSDPDSSCAEDNPEKTARAHEEQLEYLSQVFDKAGEDDSEEVPDYLCCKITLEILHDPVMTPSGITYERAAILDHLWKVGKFDPITREPLEQHQLVPNFAIKDAVAAFLDKHGWAYRFYVASPSVSDEE